MNTVNAHELPPHRKAPVLPGISPGLLVVPLLFGPLAFGAVEVWSTALLQGLVLALVLVHLIGPSAAGGPERRPVPAMIPLVLFLLFAAFQLLPLPLSLVVRLSPGAAAVWAGDLGLAGDSWVPLSLVPKGTVAEFFRLASCGAFYWISFNALGGRSRQLRAAEILTAFGALLAAASIVQHFTGVPFLLAFRSLPGNARPFGPYVNANHYAGLMEMLLPLSLSLFLLSRSAPSPPSSLRGKAAAILSGRPSPPILHGLGFTVIALSIVFSLSRGGIIASAFSISVLCALLIPGSRREERKRLLVPALAALLLVLLGALWWGPSFERFGKLRGEGGTLNLVRPVEWRDTLAVGLDFPVTGSGFGTFADVYPGYRTLPGTAVLAHAHSDPLELFAEGGVVGALFFAVFLAFLTTGSLRSSRRRRDGRARFIFAGSAAGGAAFLLHGLADFNFHIGANALCFFFFLALAAAAARREVQGGAPPGFTAPRFLSAAAVVAVLSAGVVFNGGILAGTFADPAAAARFDPLEGGHRNGASRSLRAEGKSEEALGKMWEALRRAPVRGEYLQRAGLLYADLGEPYVAEHYLRSGVVRDRTNPLRRQVLASWLLSRGKLKEGLEVMASAIAMDPGATEEYVALLVLYGVDDEGIGAALPKRRAPLLHFARYLFATGREEPGERYWLEGIGAAEAAGTAAWADYYGLYSRYMAERRFKDASSLMSRASSSLPGEARAPAAAGKAFEVQGDRERAAEAYRTALAIDGKQSEALVGLERLDASSPTE